MFELKVSRGDLLRRAVATLIEIEDEGTVNYSPNGVSLAALDKHESLHAVLRIKSFISDNDLFRCNNSGVGGVDLDEFYENLILGHDEELSITIHSDEGQDGFYFLFRRIGSNSFTRYVAMDLEAVNKVHVDAEIKLNYEYKLVLGILSNEFVGIFRYLGRDSDTAEISVTNGQVKFYANKENHVILRKEYNECFIGGVGGEDEIKFKINLYNLHAFRKASRVSGMVWLLVGDDAPVTLNCPVGAIGHIMFYFT